MHSVNGIKGWKHWHDNGNRMELENPAWRQALGQYVEFGGDGLIKLNPNSAPAYGNRASAYFSLGEYDRARRDIDTAMASNPTWQYLLKRSATDILWVPS